LWLPVSSDVIYKAKPAIDTLFARGGDLLATLTIVVSIRLIAIPMESLFVVNVALVIIWLLATILVVREHRLLQAESPGHEAG
jgi:ATP/ADP translocase